MRSKSLCISCVKTVMFLCLKNLCVKLCAVQRRLRETKNMAFCQKKDALTVRPYMQLFSIFLIKFSALILLLNFCGNAECGIEFYECSDAECYLPFITSEGGDMVNLHDKHNARCDE